MNTPHARRRGSALVITVVMILVMVAMIGLLLAAPNAQLQQVAMSTARERSVVIADAGARDAIVFLMKNKVNLTSWVNAGSTLYVTTKPGMTSASFSTAIPSGMTQATGLTPDPAATNFLVLVDNRSLASASSFPTFTENNFKPFGDGRTYNGTGQAINAYAYAIVDMTNGYYRVLVEGRTLNSQAMAANQSQVLVTRLEVYVYNPIAVVTNPGAVTFANPNGGQIINTATGTTTGWTNPDSTTFTDAAANPPSAPMIYTSTKGGGADKVSNTPAGFVTGIDTATPASNTSGVAIQNGGMYFDNATGVAAGSPAVDASANVSVYKSIDSVVNTIANLTPGTSGVSNYTYTPGLTIDLGNATPTVTYIKIPDNTVVTSTLLNFNGSATFSGVIIVDVGSNVQFNFQLGSVALFNFNGNPNQELGAFVFYQRGNIKVPSDGVYLGDNKGNGSSKLNWNSYDYRTALSNVKVPLKIASYRVLKYQ